jgi:hypothetical protein
VGASMKGGRSRFRRPRRRRRGDCRVGCSAVHIDTGSERTNAAIQPGSLPMGRWRAYALFAPGPSSSTTRHTRILLPAWLTRCVVTRRSDFDDGRNTSRRVVLGTCPQRRVERSARRGSTSSRRSTSDEPRGRRRQSTSSALTSSAIASAAVRPGDSIP